MMMMMMMMMMIHNPFTSLFGNYFYYITTCAAQGQEGKHTGFIQEQSAPVTSKNSMMVCII